MPTANDLWTFLIGAGLMAASPSAAQKALDLAGAASSAKDDFEQDIQYEPFLAGVASLRKYDPREVVYPPEEMPMLDLGGGLLSVTTFKVGVTATSPGLTLTLNQDYFLRPARAPQKNRPYTWIEFYRAVFPPGVIGAGYPDSIQITGPWGFAATVPDWAFQAALFKAGLRLIPSLALAINNGLIRWRRGDEEKQWGPHPLTAQREDWQREYHQAIGRYQRRTIL